MEKHYWRSLAEREDPSEFARAAEAEFSENPLQQIELGSSRRGFLKAAGFTFAGAALTGCSRAPVEKAMPYLVQPENMVAGRAQYYASTCGACSAGCGLLAKVRDGRPIKLEGNPDQAISRGATCAVGQASILGLYDSLRLKQPLAGGNPSTWAEVDRAILARLRPAGAIRYLSGTVASPTRQAAIDRFLAQFHNARHVMYDALSASAILDAHQQTHGARVLPHYRFDKAGRDRQLRRRLSGNVDFARRVRAGLFLAAAASRDVLARAVRRPDVAHREQGRPPRANGAG